MRFLIVNADDFGLTSGINRGIIAAHKGGIVTSASLMVRYAAAVQAAELAKSAPKLSVGLHLDLAEWRYQNGNWEVFYEVVNVKDPNAIKTEVERQLSLFQALMGCLPTHLDSHQHVHKSEPVREILQRVSEKLRVPLRGCEPFVRHRGDFYGQTADGQAFPSGISAARLIEIIERIEPGWTEIGCHPGDADGLDSIYRIERETELRVLCSAEIWRALNENKIELVSFRDLGRGIGAPPG